MLICGMGMWCEIQLQHIVDGDVVGVMLSLCGVLSLYSSIWRVLYLMCGEQFDKLHVVIQGLQP